MSEPPSSSSKLFIRSEVLAATTLLGAIEEPSKQEKAKQVKRLQAIGDQLTVQKVLIKELQRSGANSRQVRVLTELLMELGTIEVVQEPLWELIQSPSTSDEVKDSANLVLRHLGDLTDPSVYLDYLDDPAALINRETERMLEVSTRNPEALIDFIDFIFSLPVDEQGNLIRSLQSDYSPDYLLNIFLPMILAVPPLETLEQLLMLLGDIRTERTALFLYENETWFQGEERLARAWKKSVSALKIAGLFRDSRFEHARKERARNRHAITEISTMYQCFATISDGIGNQGIIVSRERENGDILMMSVAINDLHGIIDCFGFYELARPDFHRLTEKFHEESSKIHASPDYCLHKLRQAETLNRRNRFRIPYEYSCWKVLLDDRIDSEREFPDLISQCQDWANAKWDQMSANLYHHPDFSAWFLEEGDQTVVSEAMDEVGAVCLRAMAQAEQTTAGELPAQEAAFVEALDLLSQQMMHKLLATEWRGILLARLADAAYLLREQKALTFSSLAATEACKLLTYQSEETPLDGFILQYGRRCVEEDLLRLKQDPQHRAKFPNRELFDRFVEAVMTAWELS